MLHLDSRPKESERPSLSVALARNEDDVRAAQSLRYRVFGEEMGARLHSREPGLDTDMFDPYCDHLLVRDDNTGEVVGTYRILSPVEARRLGNYYSESEFDLTRLQHIRNSMVEVGRSCVHPDYRTGCASVSMADGGHLAASLFEQLKTRVMSPVEWRVFPRCPLPLDALERNREVEVPPLIRGYLRAGAVVCGDPAWDPDFNTADLFILLPMSRMNTRYKRHFIDAA
jgi:putative hemolysin